MPQRRFAMFFLYFPSKSHYEWVKNGSYMGVTTDLHGSYLGGTTE